MCLKAFEFVVTFRNNVGFDRHTSAAAAAVVITTAARTFANFVRAFIIITIVFLALNTRAREQVCVCLCMLRRVLTF